MLHRIRLHCVEQSTIANEGAASQPYTTGWGRQSSAEIAETVVIEMNRNGRLRQNLLAANDVREPGWVNAEHDDHRRGILSGESNIETGLDQHESSVLFTRRRRHIDGNIHLPECIGGAAIRPMKRESLTWLSRHGDANQVAAAEDAVCGIELDPACAG